MFVGPSGCGKTTSAEDDQPADRADLGHDHHRRRGRRASSSADELRRHDRLRHPGRQPVPAHDASRRTSRSCPSCSAGTQDADRRARRRAARPRRPRPGAATATATRASSPAASSSASAWPAALAADPPVILMDEPFGAVDPITRQRLQDELLRIQRELRKTIVCVTHDIDEAIKLGDRIADPARGRADRAVRHPRERSSPPRPTTSSSDFIGAGSTLKQLTLARVSEIELRGAADRDRSASGRPRSWPAPSAPAHDAVVVLDDRGRPRAGRGCASSRGETVPTLRPRGARLARLPRHPQRRPRHDADLQPRRAPSSPGDRDQYLGVIDFAAVTDHMRVAAGGRAPAGGGRRGRARGRARRTRPAATAAMAERRHRPRRRAPPRRRRPARRAAAQPAARDRADAGPAADPGHRWCSLGYVWWRADRRPRLGRGSQLAWPTDAGS